MVGSFSQLIPLPGGTLTGYINLSDRSEYYIKIHWGRKQFSCDKYLKKKLDAYPFVRDGLFNRVSSNTDVVEKLISFLEQSVVATTCFDKKQTTKYIKEIAKLPSEIVKSFDNDLITLQYTDSGERTHFISLDLSMPNISFITALPEIFAPNFNAVEDVYRSFTAIVDKYQDFWNVLDGIDNDTWVIEPNPGTRDIPRRRIVLSEGASIIINIDPLQPNSLPRCTFLGSSDTVQPLQVLLDENSIKWNTHLSVAENLAEILELDLPLKEDVTNMQGQTDCSICYEYKFESEIPEVFCVQCKQNYHKSCLNEWFRSLPNVRHCFGTIFGECPYCSKAMHIQSI